MKSPPHYEGCFLFVFENIGFRVSNAEAILFFEIASGGDLQSVQSCLQNLVSSLNRIKMWVLTKSVAIETLTIKY